MKKFSIIALLLLLSLALLTACGGDKAAEPEAVNPPGESEAAETTATETATATGDDVNPMIRWMQEGKFSFDFTQISDISGTRVESTGSMAVDGENVAMTMQMNMGGLVINTRTIVKDGTAYIISDEAKSIIVMSGLTDDATGGVATDYSGIVKVGNGTGEIEGRTLPYEEYADSASGISVKYYLDGNQVYGYVTEANSIKATMLIKNPKNDAPASAFELPSGYTQTAL